MIRYTLRCQHGHEFDAWFGSSDSYDTQRAASQVSCAVCGSTEVEKAMMAPAVGARSNTAASDPQASRAEDRPLDVPATPREAALKRLRQEIEKRYDYVGPSFAAEARDIHDGTSETRGIWGEASPDEARALLDDGIPVAPLPFMTKRNS